jgi:hypothetical protein
MYLELFLRQNNLAAKNFIIYNFKILQISYQNLIALALSLAPHNNPEGKNHFRSACIPAISLPPFIICNGHSGEDGPPGNRVQF